MIKFIIEFIIISSLFFSGCATKIIKVPKKRYPNALVQANGCGRTFEEAKENAKANLSLNIISIVNSSFETKRERDNFIYSSSAKKRVKVKSSFLIISPKFDNHFIKKEPFKPDIHCVDVYLDRDSLKKYENIANGIYKELYQIIKKRDKKIEFRKKGVFARKMLYLYRDEVKRYNRFINFINYLANREVRPIFNIEHIKSMINGSPEVDFKIVGELYPYRVIKLIPLVNDEDIKSLKYQWIINNRIFNRAYLNIKFPKSGNYYITLKVTDNQNLTTKVRKKIVIK